MREAILSYFDNLYGRIESLTGWVAFYQELAAREAWTSKKLLPLIDNHEVKEHVFIERQVNTMDPDFNFSKVIFGEETNPKKPLSLSATR